MIIVVCTAWRYKSTQDIVTFKNLPLDLIKDKLWLCVPEEEKHLHKWPNLVTVPAGKVGYSNAIDHFIKVMRKRGERHVLFLDDDLRLCVRRIDNKRIYKLAKQYPVQSELRAALGMKNDDYWRYIKAPDESMLKLFRTIEKLLKKGYAQVSISNRLNNNRYPYRYRYNCRAMQAWALDLKVVKKLGHHFRRMKIKQDMEYTLRLLENGYTTIQICHWLVDGRGSNAKGGVSTYRTPELMHRAAERLNKFHPGHVKIVFKKTKWRGAEEGHYDVVCSWKKATEAGGADKKLPMNLMEAL
jgi:hypothetical protein